ncbi:murein transglycosylase A [Hellea balneolensis]|uniref:murein transglycosylase A n=1 Tax=Hellea balneolensis TaxID=287478 RepID=UPI0004272B10|nr:MltA domain-containing protein [Hellea balneolensis]
MLRRLLSAAAILSLSACATIAVPPQPEITEKDSVISAPEPSPELKEEIAAAPSAEPEIDVIEPLEEEAAPPPPPSDLPLEVEIFETPKWYSDLPFWRDADQRPALKSFLASCASFAKADLAAELNPRQPEYGRYNDWMPACDEAFFVGDSRKEARRFFEDQFAPLVLARPDGDEGLLTGYYEPEIDVRKTADPIYSEPILAKPKSELVQNLERSQLGPNWSRVIAYGKPIDVFFMQIQGSGRIKFKDGSIVRAAYAANNGRKYKSIGKVLVSRGEMTVEQASKQAISDWMERAGPEKTRALMNENPRYIFFTEQKIAKGQGPRGAMRVPLTAMGSMAVDPRYHPYGTLAWLETTLPQKPGDYKGKKTGVLVSVQDTGSAIRGPLRGDLFFGPGNIAGDKAGVMKHPVRWTILVPKAIAPKPIGIG